jgi:hypothetical protein
MIVYINTYQLIQSQSGFRLGGSSRLTARGARGRNLVRRQTSINHNDYHIHYDIHE